MIKLLSFEMSGGCARKRLQV